MMTQSSYYIMIAFIFNHEHNRRTEQSELSAAPVNAVLPKVYYGSKSQCPPRLRLKEHPSTKHFDTGL